MPTYLYRSSDNSCRTLISVETAACCDAQYLSPPLLLEFQRVDVLHITSNVVSSLSHMAAE